MSLEKPSSGLVFFSSPCDHVACDVIISMETFYNFQSPAFCKLFQIFIRKKVCLEMHNNHSANYFNIISLLFQEMSWKEIKLVRYRRSRWRGRSVKYKLKHFHRMQ